MCIINQHNNKVVGKIKKAIQKADIGLTPSNDGNLIRINIPALTEERRKELTKVVSKYTEEARIQVRNIRRDANDQLRKSEKDGELNEDELRSSEDQVQKSTDDYIGEMEQLASAKETEIMEV